MKETVVYDMYRYLGADASLCNYAKISVNGEYWSVYLALEAVEQSFMLRNFGTQDGELYKPDSMGIGGGDKSSSDSSAPSMGGMDFSGMDLSDFAGKTPPSGGFSFGGRSSDGETASKDGTESTEDGRPSFEGFSGMGVANQTTLKNLITFGICMAVMLAALFAVILLKRRNQR